MSEFNTAERFFVPMYGKDSGIWAEVSAEDYPWAVEKRWRLVSRYPAITDGKTTKALHRLVMGEPAGLEVDHIDGNRLNARRDNLRICTRQQNAFNRKPQKGYKGVYFMKRCEERGWKPWRATIGHEGIGRYLGRFWTELEAAAAYNAAALELHGEYARLNLIK